MNKRNAILIPLLFVLGAGTAIFLSFERKNIVFALLFLPFFLRPLDRLTTRQKCFAYAGVGIVLNLGGFYWIAHVAGEFGGMPSWLSGITLFFFAATNNLNFPLWAYLHRRFNDSQNPFIIAALFAFCEAINPQIFPWYMGALLDHVLIYYQSADLWGITGLSFVTIVLAWLPFYFWQNRHTFWRIEKAQLSLALIAFFGLLTLYGIVQRDHHQRPHTHPLAINAKTVISPTLTPRTNPNKKQVIITVIQSNTALEKFFGERQSRAQRFQHFSNLLERTRLAVSAVTKSDLPHLVIWPEGGVHLPILRYKKLFEKIQEFAREHQVYFSFNTVTTQPGEGYFNTQLFVNPDGQEIGRYHKIILLAFGEYIPLVDTFPLLKKMLPRTISQFSRGKEKPVLDIGGINMLPLICYEDIIRSFIFGFNHANADLMINMTNDGWFGPTEASYLHRQMARVQTVSFRKPFVRALNTGVSGVYDATGASVIADTQLYKNASFSLLIDLPKESSSSFYGRYGQLLFWLFLVAMTAWCAKQIYLSRRQTTEESTQ